MEIRLLNWIMAVTVLLLAVHDAENTRDVRLKSAGELDNRDGRREQTLTTEDDGVSSGDGLITDEDEDEKDYGSGFDTAEGNSEGEDDDLYDRETDESDFEGSADDSNVLVDVPPTTSLLTRCQEQRNAKQTSGYEGYRPQCTDTGAFEPMQCYKTTNECWCVDSAGNQIGEQYRFPKRPTCHPESGIPRPDGRHSTLHPDLGDFTIIESSTGSNNNMKPPRNEFKKEEPDIEPLPAKNWMEYLLHNPLILAAAIGGSVLILILIILMLMFCIYRMRKKDEGSYSLDEPRQTFNYTRAKDKEFFA